MRVVFVNYHSLACNSGGHLINLVQSLGTRNISTSIFVPFDPEAVQLPAGLPIECLSFSQLDAWLATQAPAPQQTLIVAWTPRENVRSFVTAFRHRIPCPYIVHLEDNERLITATHLGLDPDALPHVPPQQLDACIPPDARLSHPIHSVNFIKNAHGVTALMDTLLADLPARQPHLVFWPGAEQVFFDSGAVDYAQRRTLGIADHERVLTYTGNLHPINQAEIRSLYIAIGILNRRGIPTRLIRTGEDHLPVFAHDIPEIHRHVIHRGRLPTSTDIAHTLALADFLVQPGRSDTFNDYRFPSKLPEFFATGRPVLLPAANLGRFVSDGEDALVLTRGDGLEIADKLTSLVASPSASQNLGAAARAFALTHFRWPAISEKIAAFYQTLIP